MESVDKRKIMELIWPVLRGGASEELGKKRVEALLKAIADGYSFPTNLDTDPPPTGGVSYMYSLVLTGSTVPRLSWIWWSGVTKKG